MTHDDLIKAVARGIEKSLAWDVERDVYAAETTIEERRKIAIAAIRAAAPLILDMAADKIDNGVEAYGEDFANEIRQLKERFQ